MAESTSKAAASRGILLFYVAGALFLLAFTVDFVQEDDFNWVLLGGAIASLAAGVTYQIRRRHS